MHSQDRLSLHHDHVYLDEEHRQGERRMKLVAGLTFVTMLVEIAGGLIFNSMALLADGFHMASHVAALGLAAFAYLYARRHAQDERFSFGTGKVSALGGFASALLLGVIALLMLWESIGRVTTPVAIDFRSATLVAVLGLAVNIVSAMLLRRDHHHDGHGHAEGNPNHSHGDHNLRGAYLHVVADALTSVLAIVALIGGRAFGWLWLDPLMGIVGAFVILWWSRGLIRASSRTLLDAEELPRERAAIRRAIEGDAGNLITDLHVWRVGSRHVAAIVAIVTHDPRPPQHYKALLAGIGGLAHVTVEVNPCREGICMAA